MRFCFFFRNFPVRAGFWLLCLLLLALYLFLGEPVSPPQAEEAAVNGLLPLVRTLLQMGFFLLAAALLLALLSTAIAWLYFRKTAVRKAQKIALSLAAQANDFHSYQLLRTGSFAPFWGNVQTVLSFSDNEHTVPVALQPKGFWGWKKESLQTATGALHLRHTKEYRLEAVRFWFRDAFGLFALPVTVDAKDIFLRTPDALDGSHLTVKPRRANELTERVDTMQRVEGDLYNSRVFATGDDMRRILWSVYARNRELMVRIPEIFEPYASVLTVFAAFKATLPTTFSPTEEAVQTALDFYKSAVWTVYQDLSKNGKELSFLLTGVTTSRSKPETVRQAIAAAHWDAAEALPDSKTQVIVFSSLATPEDLVALLDAFSRKRSVVLVRLSEAFNTKSKSSFLSRILFRSSREGKEARLQQLRSRMLAAQLRQREEKLLSILHEYDSLAAQLPEKVA